MSAKVLVDGTEKPRESRYSRIRIYAASAFDELSKGEGREHRTGEGACFLRSLIRSRNRVMLNLCFVGGVLMLNENPRTDPT